MGRMKSNKKESYLTEYYYRLKFHIAQHYCRKTIPQCQKCGYDNLKELVFHHTKSTKEVLLKKLDISITDNIKYWNWLIEHHYPDEHNIMVLCKKCHSWIHAGISPHKIIRLRRSIYWQLKYKQERPRHFPPQWIIDMLVGQGVDMSPLPPRKPIGRHSREYGYYEFDKREKR